MSEDIAISVQHVSKSFRLPHEKQSSIKGSLISMVKGGKRTFEKQEVLKDVSFDIKKGEFFGIVGRNGSGKSTLLKMLAGIYTPSKGDIHINGKLTPFIELGVGFNPELTGRENVFLNGALLGFNRSEMLAMYDEIVEFAELHKFMDQKLKNYSSGMQVRLAFSIAIRAKSDILVLDEVLAVGDEAFQQKCNDYFERLKIENRTIVLVTHSMGAVEAYCDRAMLIHDGNVKLIGDPTEVAHQYSLDNYDPKQLASNSSKQLTSTVTLLEVRTTSKTRLQSNEYFEFDVDYRLSKTVPIFIGISVMYEGVPIFQHNSRSIKLLCKKNTKYTVHYKLPLASFTKAKLKLDVAILKDPTAQLLGFKTNACEFFVETKLPTQTGPMLTQGVWEQGGQNGQD